MGTERAAIAGASLAGRRILIAGGASGIGAATAQLFAAEGASLALIDIDADRLTKLAYALSAKAAMTADIADATAVARAVERAASELGGIDGVVNAAGIACRVALPDLGVETWNRTLAVNLTGAFLVCQAALPYLAREPAATIVNVSSSLALRPAAGRSAYAAAKAGLIAFSRAIAGELGPKIRVNVVCPGAVDTPMFRGSQRLANASVRSKPEAVSLERIGQADEIAQSILFLTGPDSSYMTGSVVTADGGG